MTTDMQALERELERAKSWTEKCRSPDGYAVFLEVLCAVRAVNANRGDATEESSNGRIPCFDQGDVGSNPASSATPPASPTAGEKPRGKPCTCDNCLGSSCACYVDTGGQLGELWYCRKRAESKTAPAVDARLPSAPSHEGAGASAAGAATSRYHEVMGQAISRTSPENISDVLDAVARLARKTLAAMPAGPAP